MASETTTVNIGLQIPAYNQANWHVPTNYNWNLIDLIFGGEVTVPALNVTTLTAGNAGEFTLPSLQAEIPAGTTPGSTYTLTYVPGPMLGFYINGLILRYGVDYTLSGKIVTLTSPTQNSGDTVYAVYFHS